MAVKSCHLQSDFKNLFFLSKTTPKEKKKKTFFNVSNTKWYRIAWKHPNGYLFFSHILFNFTLYSCFWHFLKIDNKKKIHPCHLSFSHISFSMLFLNVARYTLVARDFTPIDVRFFPVFILFCFLKLFLKQNNQHCSCWHCPRNFYKTFSQDQLVWPFSVVFRGKSEILKVQKFGKKKNVFFALTNFLKVSILKSPQKATYLFKTIFRTFVLT